VFVVFGVGLFWVGFLWGRLIWVFCESLFVVVCRVGACWVWVLGGGFVPLTEFVRFKVVLQRGNRFQLPRVIRWRFRLECDQVFKVTLMVVDGFGVLERFYARMDKSGRVTVPKLTRMLLQSRVCRGRELAGMVVEVRLEPA